MVGLDAKLVERALGERARARLERLEVFDQLDSTNSYLIRQAAPEPRRYRVAIARHQTAGRGRRGRTWHSPPDSGLCLSVAYTFSRVPANLSALTLALGLGLIDALASMGVGDVKLKWPNDLVIANGKLGGILTEAQTGSGDTMTVVTGVGINIRLEAPLELGEESEGALPPAGLVDYAVPERSQLAAGIVDALQATFVEYERRGFAAFIDRWPEVDWLMGRRISVDAPRQAIAGIGAGIDSDGSLLVDTGATGLERVASGSVTPLDFVGRDR